jgi:hypothetical protein
LVLEPELPGWFPSSSQDTLGWPVVTGGEISPGPGGVLVGAPNAVAGASAMTPRASIAIDFRI